MGLKITVPIGTDRGISKEAYVRISSYNIQKSGIATFSLELFLTQAESLPDPTYPAMHSMNGAVNREIGSSFMTKLEKKVILTRTIKVPVQKSVTITETITTPSLIEGEEPVSVVSSRDEIQTVMEDSTEEFEATVPDLSILSEISIFEYAYGKLKEELQTSFGIKSVIDC